MCGFQWRRLNLVIIHNILILQITFIIDSYDHVKTPQKKPHMYFCYVY